MTRCLILGVAAVLASTTVTWFPSLVSSHAAILADPRARLLLPALLVIFVLLVGTTGFAYSVRRYKRVLDSQALYDYYRDKSEYFIKARVFTAMVTASKEIEHIISCCSEIRYIFCELRLALF
jgi:hypothetical protein